MKHIRSFNEALVNLDRDAQDIINIARDEGLIVSTHIVKLYSGRYVSKGGINICIYNFTLTNGGVQDYSRSIIDSKAFVSLIKNLYQRLDNEGLIIKQTNANIFTGGVVVNRMSSDLDLYNEDIVSDIPDGYDAVFARLLIHSS